MARQTALPPTLPPRLISREAAAAFVNVSPGTFDEMVKAGTMPKPRVVHGRRRAFDVTALNAAIDALAFEGEDAADDTWA